MLSRLCTAFPEMLFFHPTPHSYWIQDDPQFTFSSFFQIRNNLKQMYQTCLLPQTGCLRLLGALLLTCGTVLP